MSHADLNSDTSQGMPHTGVLGGLSRIVFLAGASALLLAMATDTLAVLGRHTGIALPGAIEFIQACIVVAASAAIVFATLSQSHASVHILTERLRPGVAQAMAATADAASAAAFLIFAGGSAWVAAELWNTYELTEILHLPLRVLRIVWISSALLASTLFILTALKRLAAR